MKISPHSAPHGCKKPVQDPDCHHQETEHGGDTRGGSSSVTHLVSYLEEAGQRVEVIKVGKFPRQGNYLDIIEITNPTSVSQNPAATKAGRDSEQVSRCSFLTPVPFPVASASDGALGLM